MKLWDFGSINIDRVYSVSSIVKEGETTSASNLSNYPGGKGLNQAVAASRAGLDVVMASAVGNDAGFVEEFLKTTGVDTSLILHTDSPTGHAVIQVDEQGRNSIIVYAGANSHLSTDYIDSILEKTKTGDAVLVQNETSNVPYIIRRAREKGLFVIFNPSPITKEIANYPLSYVNMLFLNEVEGAAIAGPGSPEQILNVLSYKLPHTMIVLTVGKDGALCFYKDKFYTQSAMKVKPIDTTAAGDTFTGYFAYSILNGKDVQESLELACKASAIAVSKKGAAPSIPTMKEVENKVFFKD